MKKIIPPLLVFIASLSSCSNPAGVIKYGSGDDYEIYRIILEDDNDSEGLLIVLRDSTSTMSLAMDSVRMTDYRDHLPGLLDETAADFIGANLSPERLDYVPGVDRLVLASDYRGNSAKVDVMLSRIGYSGTRTQAMVEVGRIWAPLVGSGCLYLLVKQDGTWKIAGKCATWIS